MSSTFTTNKTIELPANGDYVNTWNIPMNGDFTIVDKALGSSVSYALTSSNITLTNTDIQNQQILLSGTLTANVSIIFPSGKGGSWIVINNTTGAYTVTAITASTAGFVLIPQSQTSFIYSDGTNIAFADSRASSSGGGGGATGGGTDQIFFLNDLAVTTSYAIPATKNSLTAGPITINAGATVSIPSSSTWTIV